MRGSAVQCIEMLTLRAVWQHLLHVFIHIIILSTTHFLAPMFYDLPIGKHFRKSYLHLFMYRYIDLCTKCAMYLHLVYCLMYLSLIGRVMHTSIAWDNKK